MTSPVVTVRPTTAVEEVAALLVRHRISAVPVVENHRLVGIVSEADLVPRHTAGDQHPAQYIKSRARQARDLMTHEVVSVAPDAPAAEVASLLGSLGVRRVPVLDGERLVGIVSRSDLVRASTTPAGNAVAPDDDSLRAAVLHELEAQHWWRRHPAAVAVRAGRVRFSGTVESEDARRAAVVAAESVPGVRGVDDDRQRVQAAPPATPTPAGAVLKRAAERIHSRLGWLESYYSLSFEDAWDARRAGFGVLRALNEKLAHPGGGASSYGQREVEVVLYVLEGEVVHRTSLDDGSPLAPGDAECVSAGTGVHRTVQNASSDALARYLEIWIQPKERGRPASCERRRFPETARRGRLCTIASPDGRDDSLPINQDAFLYYGSFDGDERAELRLAAGRKRYVHVARGRITVNGQLLEAGDALMDGADALVLERGQAAEVLVFDLPESAVA